MNGYSDKKPVVCFFDSGIGGLPFLYSCSQKADGVDLLYFADNFNVPYGRFSHDKLIEATDEIFAKIAEFNPVAAVIACNTVTAHCATFLRNKYNFPIVGVQPAVKPAARYTDKCVVLSTVATAKSNNVANLVSTWGRGVTQVIACPELAAYIEKNIFNLDKQKILSMLPEINAGTVVLGCTHYIYVKKIVEEFYACPVYDGVEGTANRLYSVIKSTIPEFYPEKGKISFLGGDENKNRLVYERVICGI